MSQQINLFNPIFLKQKKYFSAVTMAQALGLLLLGAIALASYAGLRTAELEREMAASSVRLAQAQSQLQKVKADFAPRQKSQTLEADIRKREAELLAMNHALETLRSGELGHSGGYSEYLRAFSRQIVSGIWLTGFTIHAAGNDIAIQGRALQPELVPNYLGRLGREPSMQGKSFSTFEMHRPPAASQAASAGYVEFRLGSSAAADGIAMGVNGK